MDVISRNPAVPGHSEAPVLNDAGEVAGVQTWHYYDRPDTTTVQRSDILTNPCR